MCCLWSQPFLDYTCCLFTDVKRCSSGQDHVRAAMTCIRFYTQGATSYLLLGEQQVFLFISTFMQLKEILKKVFCTDCKLDFAQRWLVRAKEHLRTYLQEQQGRGAVRRKSQVNSFRKTMSSSDVSRLF